MSELTLTVLSMFYAAAAIVGVLAYEEHCLTRSRKRQAEADRQRAARINEWTRSFQAATYDRPPWIVLHEPRPWISDPGDPGV